MSQLKPLLHQLNHSAFEHHAGLPEDYQEAVFEEGMQLYQDTGVGPEQRTVLLVGGAGYIGSVVTEQLLAFGYQVRCLDLLLYGNQVCVMPYLGNPNYRFYYGDLSNREVLQDALEGCSDVIVLAGLVGDPITKKYPDAAQRINLDGVSALIRDLNGRGLNKLMFISTCSNYGLIKDNEKADEQFELNPLSLYAQAKVAIEQQLLEPGSDTDYCATVLRFATAFGLSPRMRFDLTVNEFTREMYLNNDLLVFDPETWRPYCHVQDFGIIIRRVLAAPRARVRGQVFNAGGDVNNCTKQLLVNKILERLPEAPVRYQQQGPDPRNYRVDFSKIRTELHFEPSHSIDDGIDEIIAALRQNLFLLVDQNRSFFGNYEIDYA